MTPERVACGAMIPRKKLPSGPSAQADRRQILAMLDERVDAVTLAELRKNPPPLQYDSDENGKTSGSDRDDVLASMARRLVRVPSHFVVPPKLNRGALAPADGSFPHPKDADR